MDEARRSLVEDAPPPVAAVDFDMTLVDENERILPGAKDALIRLKSSGWTIVIWTTREDLEDVRRILADEGVPFDFINENPDTDVGAFPRKVYFDVVVDDKAIPFQGNWGKIIDEMERRRKGWKADGLTKGVRLRQASAEGEETIGTFYMKDGEIVVESASPIIGVIMETGLETKDGAIVKPDDGVEFLKALSEIRGTYLWSETF